MDRESFEELLTKYANACIQCEKCEEGGPQPYGDLFSEAERLNLEILNAFEGISKDAARYQWLRDRDLDTISQGGVFAGLTPENLVLNGIDLDEAVDKGMES